MGSNKCKKNVFLHFGGWAYLRAIGVADNRATFNDVQLGNGISIMTTVTVLAGLWCEWLRCGCSSWWCCCCWWLIGCFRGLWYCRRVEWWFWWFCRYYLWARLQNQEHWQGSGTFTYLFLVVTVCHSFENTFFNVTWSHDADAITTISLHSRFSSACCSETCSCV